MRIERWRADVHEQRGAIAALCGAAYRGAKSESGSKWSLFVAAFSFVYACPALGGILLAAQKKSKSYKEAGD